MKEPADSDDDDLQGFVRNAPLAIEATEVSTMFRRAKVVPAIPFPDASEVIQPVVAPSISQPIQSGPMQPHRISTFQDGRRRSSTANSSADAARLATELHARRPGLTDNAKSTVRTL